MSRGGAGRTVGVALGGCRGGAAKALFLESTGLSSLRAKPWFAMADRLRLRTGNGCVSLSKARAMT